MSNTATVTVSPKRTVRAMSRAQLEKQLEGTGVVPSNHSRKELESKVREVTSEKASALATPFKGEY